MKTTVYKKKTKSSDRIKPLILQNMHIIPVQMQ